MTNKIYCRTTGKGIQSFYLIADGKEYYLFEQNYRISNKEVFCNSVTLDEAIALRAHRSHSVSKTAKKLVSYVRYIEQEYGMYILRKTLKKKGGKSKGRAVHVREYFDEAA